MSKQTAYLGKAEFLSELKAELAEDLIAEHGTLLIANQQREVAFALDVWPNVQTVHFESISEAQRILRAEGSHWVHYPVSHVRRGTLIQEGLRRLPALKALPFPLPALPRLGGFSLLDPHTLVYSTHPLKNIPGGQYCFQEDKVNPPNRAYLKLWEALSIEGSYPQAGDRCLDLGASPGGWTFVLQQLGAEVWAVDKAPLAPHIAALPNVHPLEQSAFALDFDALPPFEYLVCDIACYPEKLFQQVQRWIASGRIHHIISTIKLQGTTDLNSIRAFQAIPDSRVMHLWHNKHEVTFFWRKAGV